jgi:hypothetical protein
MTSSRISGPILQITSPNRQKDGHSLINGLTQKGDSLQVPISITYLHGEYVPNAPQEVTVRIFPISWPHPLGPAEKLPSYQVLNMQAEYIKTGKYDKNLLYDTAQLVSFPTMKLDSSSHARIQLHSNVKETIDIRITIPQDFPDYLLNKPVFVEVNSKVESLNIEASITLGVMVIG